MSNLIMCPICNGSGIGSSGDANSSCSNCGGDGGIIYRDANGKFKKYIVNNNLEIGKPMKDLETTEKLSQLGDDMAAIQKNEYELSEYLKTDEAQLSGYSTQQLNDEIARRMFEPYKTELINLRDTLDSMIANQEKPF